ncbi:MAG: sigma-70 family RNA polymerase sigma factor [Phycisphaerales bacterium]|nr:sigma-70 family RNA polymerase sigma factor [Phycisphaerales bacterium]
MSHPVQDGGDFLPHHETIQNTDVVIELKRPRTYPASDAWVKCAMSHFKATGCNETRTQLLHHYHESFVKPVARSFVAKLPKSVDLADIEQCGFIALNNQLDKFDTERNVCFEAFSRLRVTGAMHDQLRRDDPVPRLARARTKQLDEARLAFKKEFGCNPTKEELRLRIGISDEEFEVLYKDGHAPSTIGMQTSEFENDHDCAPIHYIGCDDQTGITEQKDLRHWICKCLDERDRLILTLYFYESLSMLEVGQSIGCSESRVSQRLQHIYKTLQFWFGEHPEQLELMAS